MSTTYDTDMFEPLAMGNCTLKAEVSDESSDEDHERQNGRERRAREEQREGEAPQRNDAEDIAARARRQVPEQSGASIARRHCPFG